MRFGPCKMGGFIMLIWDGFMQLEMIRKSFKRGPVKEAGYGQANRVGLIYGSMKRLIGFIS